MTSWHGNRTLDGAVVQANLRVLATSDLHMNLRAFDYFSGKSLRNAGLAQLATLIGQARQEAGVSACILLDNGDALQGTPVADTAAEAPVCATHPLARVFDALAYDAVGLGNHDFDYGLSYLADVSARYSAPTLSSNVTSDFLPDLLPWVVIDRDVTCSDGRTLALKVGVLSVLPEQTMLWNSQHLTGRATVANMHEAVQAHLPAVRAAGADVVVLLAHSGIGLADAPPNAENAALQLAAHSGIDAVIAGHTHGLFPSSDRHRIAGTDPVSGTLHGRPAAMPGFGGSHLAVLDMALAHEDGTWRVISHTSTLRPAISADMPDPAILRATQQVHERTNARLSERLGHSSSAIHSYFSLIRSSSAMRFSAQAKRAALLRHLSGRAFADLPVLASASAFAAGGLSGPGNYVSFGPGTVHRRDLNRLTPFENYVWGSVLTGAEVREWLERSAAVFATVAPDRPSQRLIDPDMPGYNFDVLHGLDFTINPTRSPRYSAEGDLIDVNASRIAELSYQGNPVAPDQRFLVASTSYRLSGGGNFPACTPDKVVARTSESVNAAMVRSLADKQAGDAPEVAGWSFSEQMGIRAVFLTATAALACLDEIACYQPVDLGTTSDGFQALRLTL